MSVQLVAVMFFEGVICMFCPVCLTERGTCIQCIVFFSDFFVGM